MNYQKEDTVELKEIVSTLQAMSWGNTKEEQKMLRKARVELRARGCEEY